MPSLLAGRTDDATILDDERLFRRIHAQQLVLDENNGKLRVSSGAFRDPELSILIESLLLGAGRTPQEIIANHPSHSLVAITARLARAHSQTILRDPEPDEPAHGLVYGYKKKCASKLAAGAEWIIPNVPPDCSPQP